MARSTEQIFEDHRNAILGVDFPKLMADYADHSILLTTADCEYCIPVAARFGAAGLLSSRV